LHCFVALFALFDLLAKLRFPFEANFGGSLFGS
jgi:hypothetical protein